MLYRTQKSFLISRQRQIIFYTRNQISALLAAVQPQRHNSGPASSPHKVSLLETKQRKLANSRQSHIFLPYISKYMALVLGTNVSAFICTARHNHPPTNTSITTNQFHAFSRFLTDDMTSFPRAGLYLTAVPGRCLLPVLHLLCSVIMTIRV